MADEKYTPIRKYVFPAGVSGGEIRINIPVYASKEDVQTAIDNDGHCGEVERSRITAHRNKGDQK